MKLKLAFAVAVVALGSAALAWAAVVDIPGPDNFQQNLKLEAQGDAFFDVYQPPDQYNDDCALGDLGGDIEDDHGFSPASDGENSSGANDLFDGGLVLWVQNGSKRSAFEDPNSRGDLTGTSKLQVGPENVRGLVVSRTEQALQAGPILRSLIRLRNPKRRAVRRTIIWDSDLGADNSEVVRDSSSGDEALGDNDRWVVVADAMGEPSDAIGLFVLYGKGASRQTKVFNPVTDQDSCVSFKATVRVPPRSVRYLLFFTEAHDNGDTGLTESSQAATRYNARRPAGVLKGIRDSIKRRVVNWDLD